MLMRHSPIAYSVLHAGDEMNGKNFVKLLTALIVRSPVFKCAYAVNLANKTFLKTSKPKGTCNGATTSNVFPLNYHQKSGTDDFGIRIEYGKKH